MSGERDFDTIVVGSGFGGSVSAFRLADGGQSVCLLERGRAYPPGSFARSPYETRRAFWDPTKGLYGLFDFWSFKGIDALVSSGLGGGSLIYANVLLRKDERWFVRDDADMDDHGQVEFWPVTREQLDPHYDRVEAMLRPQTYPVAHEPYSQTPKTRAFAEAAKANGLHAFQPPLAVTFANDGDAPVTGEPIREPHANLHGRTRYTCRLCGECDVGCNFGSKNTLDYNYLTEAQRAGAELRTRADVRSLDPLPGGGWAVHYADYSSRGDGEATDLFDPALELQTVTADRVVLAAGTLGTVRLLLRNRAAVPGISRRLGSRFCGNGDLLTFALKCSETSGVERVPRVVDPSRGPVITSAVRVPDALDGGQGRGFYLEDAGFPAFATWMLQMFEMPGDLWRDRRDLIRLAREHFRRDNYRHTGRSAFLAGLFGEAQLSAGLLPMLGMGRDVPDGQMYLRHNHLRVDWAKGKSAADVGPQARSAPYFARVRELSRRFADVLGADFRDNPMWFLSRVITVHPLGGCPMGRHEGEGVVDANGEVFGCPGLYVADGSVMPGPVGPNPSLTIAALADRFSDGILGKVAA
jgi:cholesterol oxidase